MGKPSASKILVLLFLFPGAILAQDSLPAIPEFADTSGQIHGADPVLDSLIIPWIGTKHRTGKQSKQGIDCSGFVQVILQEYLQYKTLRSSAENFERGTTVEAEELLPGDVVFFRKRGRIYHSGVWIGNGRFAHASTTLGVIVTELEQDSYWHSHYAGARRYRDNPRFATPPPDSTKDSNP